MALKQRKTTPPADMASRPILGQQAESVMKFDVPTNATAMEFVRRSNGTVTVRFLTETPDGERLQAAHTYSADVWQELSDGL